MPETINGFQVLRKVAESNTAEIFHVLRLVGRGRGGEYALKVLREEYADDHVERSHLQTEFDSCQGLKHPNLVTVHDLQLDTDRPYLVMEYINGWSLRDYLAHGHPTGRTTVKWLAQVADGLEYFHNHGYVHRDVKPQNICIGRDQVVRVIDFALALSIRPGFGRRLLRKLVDRRRPGTRSYMAPEQILSKRITGQADVYSLGVTIFETMTGRLPYSAETPQGLMKQHLRAPIPSMRPLRGDTPAVLDDLVQGMLEKDPLDRPRGMEYVSMKLREAAKAFPRGQ